MKLISPLRYPGSKRKLTNYFKKILSHNKRSPKVFIEPFVGGGSVFLAFLNKESVERIVIGDKDELISAFWKTLFSNAEYLVSFVRRVKVTLKRFDYYRKIAENPQAYNVRQRAKACLFLNRTSFSGILNSTAGPIGGRGQESEYRIDCRFGREKLIKKIKAISAYKDKVTVLESDWKKTLEDCLNKFEYEAQEFLIYLDPPFYEKADALYRHYFSHEDHKSLRDEIINLQHPWILSYDRAKEIEELYSTLKRIHVRVPYSINSPAKRLEKELIITPLDLPKMRSSSKKK